MSLPRVLLFSSLLAASVVPLQAADGVTAAKPVSPGAPIELFTPGVADNNFVVAFSPFTLQVDPSKAGTKAPSTVCYALREYKFARVPATDALKPSGASTCENSAQFQVKTAVGAPAH